MKKYIITTDGTSDLPEEFYQEHKIGKLFMSYMIQDTLYDSPENALPTQEFYEKVRNGAMPVTQQANPENSKLFFEQFVKEGYDIIHIAFTSGMSGTYNSNRLGAEEIMEEYPECKVTVIDSLCASMGEGLLVHEAVKRWEAGMDYDQLIQWIEAHKLHVIHEVVADDLFHLHRGGRVSKVSAIVGTTLGVKPIIHLNEEGKLISFAKQRHKVGGLKYIANNLKEKIKIEADLKTIAISHSDCKADAEKLAKLIRESVEIDEILISDIGPAIGSHTGVGTIALFYFADTRNV